MTNQDHNPARYISRYRALRIVIKPTFTREVDGRIVTVTGKDVRFEDGAFETSDPEIIAFLEADKSFGSTYIRVPDNVADIVKERGEWMKDLETKEKELAEREAALKERENRINASEEGGKAGDGLDNLKRPALLAIIEDEKVDFEVKINTTNVSIVEAIRAHRAKNAEGDSSNQSAGAEGDKPQY